MRLRRLLEIALVLMVLGVVAWAVKQRFDEIVREARRVQVRMAAQTLLTNAQLLQLRCPAVDDLPCLRAAGRELMRAAVARNLGREPLALPLGWGLTRQRLWLLAAASGVGEDQAALGARWQHRWMGEDQLTLTLPGSKDCGFVLQIHASTGTVRLQNLHLIC